MLSCLEPAEGTAGHRHPASVADSRVAAERALEKDLATVRINGSALAAARETGGGGPDE